ncbi:Fur family transcriptional regulator [Fulvivirga sedimenti]|uniref:Transcriptional repressor n=1 Tax=Fulvivirga sedimenti TaxID=2879465 RepID=A0A9X1HUP3_9BACT|nr:transcriptional repressor [Fulvivirga sedimenti]MCA6078011.1 transcriptional repressor [Fulvivirga sedimenti]
MVRQKIMNAGLRVTPQRMVILDAIQGMNNHPTADDIYLAIHPANPGISMATVYKTLETYVDSGLLQKVYTREGQMRYDPRIDNHGHIYCTNTGEIIDFYDDELNKIITAFFRKKKVSNIRISNISLQINALKTDPGKSISIK